LSTDPIVITAARRTPIGSFQGSLAPCHAPALSAAATRACLEDTGLPPEAVDEALIGCVLPAGIGQAPARQAVLAAGLPASVNATTLNKVCGSGMYALMLAHDRLRAGSASVILAGGMESMSNAPYLLPKARAGYRMGHQEVLDHMFYDGLQNPYDGQMMGQFGDATASRHKLTREMQDNFAIESVRRAQAAARDGLFAAEITPVTVTTRRGETVIHEDEEPGRCDIARIPSMRPAFGKEGTVTAATSSSIADGAASLLLMAAAEADRRGLAPLARIVGHASFAHDPAWFTTAPVSAIRRLLDRTGWRTDDVDLFEINEAFACVTMVAMQEIGIGHDRVNINGGACALGHPIGATGARIVTTLVHALAARGLKRGIASLCIGGGEATAIAIERA
jgi:acetyl-CoA C-acetyltransferase